MKKKLTFTLPSDKYKALVESAGELVDLQTLFAKFSDDRWQKEGELLRRLQNAEASNQHLSKENVRLQTEHAKVHKTAVEIALDRDKSAQANVKLVFMLDEVRIGYNNLVKQIQNERDAKTA